MDAGTEAPVIAPENIPPEEARAEPFTPSSEVQDISVQMPVASENVPVSEDAGIPDWLKGMPTETTLPVPEEKPVEEAPQITVPAEPELPAIEPSIASDEGISGLPAWMQGMDQESLKQEVEEEIKSTPVIPETKEAAHEDDIPDWLKGTVTAPTESTVEPQETPKVTDEVVPTAEEKPETKQKSTQHSKKPAKAPAVKAEGDDVEVPSRPKKKKPTPPTVSEGPTIPATDDDLPDWLK